MVGDARPQLIEICGDDNMHVLTRAAVLLGAVWLTSTMWMASPTLARDDGRYANSPLKPWFESLHSGYGQCCSDADG
ncbi:MAG: hypothetical protein ACI4XG_20485, partial [Bradyrhizobium sp.]